MTFRTWTYDNGRSRTVYLWAKRWTLHIVFHRKRNP